VELHVVDAFCTKEIAVLSDLLLRFMEAADPEQ